MKDNYLDKLEQISLNKSQNQTKPQEAHMNTIHEILQERNATHGDFREGAKISQHLKKVVATYGVDLIPAHKESLDMIMHKIARLLNGDPMHKDTWHDIMGYTQLAINEIDLIKLDTLNKDNAV